MKYVTGLLLLSWLFYSCSSQTKQAADDPCRVEHPEWTRSAVIYEVNVRQYTPEGSFEAFERHLPRLRDLGVDILWFMPIHPISQTKRKGSLGSYYAISDYKAVNPEFGTLVDFKRLVEKAHEMGFKVMLDWVANHSGWDCHWLHEHPDWYVCDSLGRPVAPYDWTDVAKLNYDNEDLRRAMLDAMRFWVENFDIDGFRCDVAYEVPTSFWEQARAELNEIKPLFMLAESEKPELLNLAFDADYAWELMHIMNAVAKGEKNVKDIEAYLFKNDTLLCPDAYKMNFLTNHDENSWNGTEYERYGAGVAAFAVLTYTLNGMPLIYSGQEVGLRKRLLFFEKDLIPSFKDNETTAFYKALNELKHSKELLKAGKEGGAFHRIPTSEPERILAFSRTKASQELIVLLNLSAASLEFSTSAVLSGSTYREYFSGEEYAALPNRLDAWEYLVLIKQN